MRRKLTSILKIGFSEKGEKFSVRNSFHFKRVQALVKQAFIIFLTDHFGFGKAEVKVKVSLSLSHSLSHSLSLSLSLPFLLSLFLSLSFLSIPLSAFFLLSFSHSFPYLHHSIMLFLFSNYPLLSSST